MLNAESITKRFGFRTVLDGLDIHIDGGELIALFGANGSGKTTLVRVLSGLLHPESGTVALVTAQNERLQHEYQQHIGVMLHQPLVYEHLTAFENLRLYARLFDLQNPHQRIQEMLKKVQLESVQSQQVHTFSRGMQQRLALARSLLHRPILLLLDEPYTGLDLEGVTLLNTILQEELAQGHAALITTHAFAQVADVATRYDVLTGGRIAASLPAAQLAAQDLQSFYSQLQAGSTHTAKEHAG